MLKQINSELKWHTTTKHFNYFFFFLSHLNTLNTMRCSQDMCFSLFKIVCCWGAKNLEKCSVLWSVLFYDFYSIAFWVKSLSIEFDKKLWFDTLKIFIYGKFSLLENSKTWKFYEKGVGSQTILSWGSGFAAFIHNIEVPHT